MAKEQPKPVFWITGNYYECQKTFERICSKLDNPRIDILDCGWVNESAPESERSLGPEDVIRFLRSRDIFDSRPRIIKMKGLPHGYPVLLDYLKYVSNKNVLVIDGPIGHRAKPPSKQFVTAKTSKFFKTIKKTGKVFEHDVEASNVSAAVSWVMRVAEEMGKPIESEAASLLVEMRGRDLDLLYGGLLILVDYAKGKKIQSSDVEEVCVPEFLKKVWDLLERISYRKYEEVAVHLQQFYEAGKLEVQSSFIREVELMLGAFNQLFMCATVVCDHLQGKLLSYDSIRRAVDQLNKPMKREEFTKALAKAGGNEDNVEYAPVFSNGFLAMKARDEGFKRIIKWGSSRLHSVYAEVNEVRLCIRKDSTEAYLKLCLDSLMMVLCGKLQRSQSRMLRSSNFTGIIE